MADGRTNTAPVLINDLDVGYENQNRKVPCYVPVGGFIDIPGSSRSLLSFDQGTIRKFHQVGVIIARMFFTPEVYTTLTLPNAADYPSGALIWNSTTDAPLWSNGTTWVSGMSGPAGGDLSGTYPDPTVVGLEGFPIENPPPSNGDALLFNGFTNQWEHAPIVFGGGPPVGPAGGDLAGLYPDPSIALLAVTDAKVAVANKDGLAAVPSMRTLGTGAQQACAGDDSRLSDARTPVDHAPTHATGGIDPLTVNSTTATNNANTTGLSVNSAAAATSVTDPGHVHTLTDPGHTHTVNSTTATNNAARVGIHETLGRINADNRTLGTIDQTVASAAPSDQTAHLRTRNVNFPAGWVGGTITINGIGPDGLAIAEVFTKPVGGGIVVGSKVYATVSTHVNSAPGGVLGTVATITNTAVLGVAQHPVAAFIMVSIDGSPDNFSVTDLVNGAFDTVGAHIGNHTIEVWYAVDVTPSQAAHTHTLNSATTGASVASHATGISVTDAGHSHGTTDPGHDHTQNSHDHTLTG
jgi:hypothetical protein